MTAPTLRIALPWLQSTLAAAMADQTVPPLASLQWLGGRGRMQACVTAPWREWLLEPTAMARHLLDWPAGSAVARAQGESLDTAHTWCVAQPVHLAAGLDHLRLAPLAGATPTAAEAWELAATIRAHFATDELTVYDAVDGAWLLRFPRTLECSTHAPDVAVGHNVHDFMPAGPAGASVRSLMNEIQMLLHDHPVNELRQRDGQLPINAWWLWGFGTGTSEPPARDGRWSLRGDDLWLHALWHPEGHRCDVAEKSQFDALQDDTLMALSQPPAVRAEDSLAAIDAGLLSWLVVQVQAGAIRRLDLLAGSSALRVDAAARFQFWRRPVALAQWLE